MEMSSLGFPPLPEHQQLKLLKSVEPRLEQLELFKPGTRRLEQQLGLFKSVELRLEQLELLFKPARRRLEQRLESLK